MALSGLAPWMHEGKLTTREHVLEGLESFPSAVQMIFAGKNRGKLLIKIQATLWIARASSSELTLVNRG